VPGVSTISADVHKYGYCIKGASVILHRDRTHLNRHQLFLWDRWPGGTYGSFAMAGARPSAPIAAAWAVLHHLGREGYLRLAREVRYTTRKLRAGIDATPGLRVIGDPVMSVLAFGSDTLDVFAVGDRMDQKGWHLDLQKGPDALHLMVSPMHARIADAFLADLREAAKAPGKSRGADARYS
jgi:glutamate/tyrosine decarboxylase-like PLP-dependent enzyme